MELKQCPKCKKKYHGQSAISKADNCTKICPLCRETEGIAKFRNYSINLHPDRLTGFEKEVRKSLVQMKLTISRAEKQYRKQQNDERSRLGEQMKRMLYGCD